MQKVFHSKITCHLSTKPVAENQYINDLVNSLALEDVAMIFKA